MTPLEIERRLTVGKSPTLLDDAYNSERLQIGSGRHRVYAGIRRRDPKIHDVFLW